jgi:hypothetical protein
LDFRLELKFHSTKGDREILNDGTISVSNVYRYDIIMKSCHAPRRNSMKHRKSVIASTVMVVAVIAAGTVFCTNNYAKAAPPSLQDVLNILPADSHFVFGMNVQKFVASPIYAKFKQEQCGRVGNDVSQFIKATGVDPERDIYYLVVSGRANQEVNGVVIAVGSFNADVITSFIRSKSAPVITEYNGTQVLMIPEGNGSKYKHGIMFLSEGEMALGDLEALKAVLDVRSKGNKSILSNAKMAPLLNGIGPDEMLWFAGSADGILAHAPVANLEGAKIPPVQNILGIVNVADSITGEITITASNEEATKQLADAVNGFIALGQLSADQDPTLQMLLSGLTVSQNINQVRVIFDFSADLLEKLGQAKMITGLEAGI